ncbi:ABC transporter permease [Rhodococcus sp. AG1013]|uniref:ABC transporter permease n=1 Tax=unclassified Rhodococcus (in: high G+C Gram-positive bacteria) TaxID=192944 RepID=UPI000E0A7279|nr:ABC transporter permease [Rhodococcus sp. AG1013]RDI22581.1 putative spermidine/putrescine transport system permease protein [Rhodococcus sp. AG1013]
MRKRSAEPWLLVLPLIALLLIAFVIPVARTLLASFTTDSSGFTLSNFTRFFGSSVSLGASERSLRMAFIQTIVSVVIAVPLAYIMAGLSAKARAFMMIATILPLMTSVVIRTFGWVILMGPSGPLAKIPGFLDLSQARQGLLGTELGVNIAMIQVLVPFAVLSVLGVINGIDVRLREASRTMGAGFVGTFRHVILPLSLPGIVSGATLCFALSISSFITPNLIGGAQLPVIAGFIYHDATVSNDIPFAATQAVLILAVVVITIAATNRIANARMK